MCSWASLLLRRCCSPRRRSAETAWERKRPCMSTLAGFTRAYSFRTCCRESAIGTHTHTQYTSFTYNQESSVKTADALHNRKEALRERTRTQLPQKKAEFPSISVQDSVRRARTPGVPCIWYASELHLRGKVQEHPACWRTAPLLSSVRFLRSSDTNAWVLCRILKGLWNTASVSYFTSSTSTSRRDLRVSGRSMQRFTQSYQSKRLQLTHQFVSYCVRTHLIQGLVAGMKGKKLDTWKRLLIFRALTL